MEAQEKIDFEGFLQSYPEYLQLFDGLQEIWQDIDNIKVPSASEKMDQRFYAMLHEDIKKAERSSSRSADKF